jgi:hypothetical protein
MFGEEYKLRSSSLRSFLQPPVTSSLLGPNILLSTLFSNTLSLRFSFNIRDQVSHPYRTTGKIIAYTFIKMRKWFVVKGSKVGLKFCLNTYGSG